MRKTAYKSNYAKSVRVRFRGGIRLGNTIYSLYKNHNFCGKSPYNIKNPTCICVLAQFMPLEMALALVQVTCIDTCIGKCESGVLNSRWMLFSLFKILHAVNKTKWLNVT